MATIKIKDQKDKDGKVIDQYATFYEYNPQQVELSKGEVQKRIDNATQQIEALQKQLQEWNDVLAEFTV